MSVIPPEINEAWENREDPLVLATVDEYGVADVIYVRDVWKYGPDKIMIADNHFDKTRRNILAGSPGALLFMTDEGRSYQLKGSFEYHTDGPVFDDMKDLLDGKWPGHAAVLLAVERVYHGSEQLV